MTASSQKLTRREREIMDILYKQPGLTAAEVQAALADGISYSAARAALSRLVNKGQLTHKREGLRYIYTPSQSPHQAADEAMLHVVKTFFLNAPQAAVGTVLRLVEGDLSPKDRAQLAALIQSEEAKRK